MANVQITDIHPSSGPTFGDTRVIVRSPDFAKWEAKQSSPMCRFGSDSKGDT